MYAKQHYYAFFFLCRLIIEQKHKILVTHFFVKTSGAFFLARQGRKKGKGRCDVLTFIVKQNETKTSTMEIRILYDAGAFSSV